MLPDWTHPLRNLYWHLRQCRPASRPHARTWYRRIADEKKRLLFGKYWSCDVRARLLSTLSGEPSDWHPLDGFFRHDAVPLDLPPPNVNSIKVEVELSLQGKRLWRGVRMVPTRVSGTLAETLQPLSNPELDREVGVWLDPAAWLHRPNRLEVHVSNESREKVFGRYVAIGARARVFRNGELVGQGTLIASPQVYRESGTMQDTTSQLIRADW